jgi:predicted ATPase
MRTHLNGFGLENFRVFKDYTWFDFAPITILTGPNSSGKSSLTKALLLLKDNFEKESLPNGALEFTSEVHGMTNTSNIKCRNIESNTITFKLPYFIFIENKDKDPELKDSPKFIIRKRKGTYKKLFYKLNFSLEKGKILPTSQIELADEKKRCFFKSSENEIFFDVELFNEITGGGIITPGFNLPLYYSKSVSTTGSFSNLDNWLHVNDITGDNCYQIRDSVYKQLGIFGKSSWRYDNNPRKLTNHRMFIDNVINNLKSITILSHNSTKQRRFYSEDNNSSFIHTLRSLNKTSVNFQEYLKDCSRLFGIDGEFKIDYDEKNQIYYPNIDGQSFSDFGFGYTQIASLIFTVLNVIIDKYIAETGEVDDKASIIILEEPESNLHPKFQSMLADFLVSVADAFEIQFIIETHSEYLIRKLQYLTAKGKLKPTDSVIYYFHEPNNVPVGQKQVKKIEIQEDGSLSADFGPGFFDEAAQWELELLRLKNQKSRNN